MTNDEYNEIVSESELFARFRHYTTDIPGGRVIDLEMVMVDVVALVKLNHRSKHQFLKLAADLWDNVAIDVVPPRGERQ